MNIKSAYILFSKGTLYLHPEQFHAFSKMHFFVFFFLFILQIPFGLVTNREESDEEEEVQMELNNLSEYSDEFDDLDLTACNYPFAEKAPEVRNFTFLLAKFFNL